MNTGIVEKNNGLKLFVDGQKNLSGIIKPQKEGWQCAKLADNSYAKTEKLKLTSGIHSLTFCSTIPEIPNVEFIRLSRNETNVEIPESQWNAFIEEAKKNILPHDYFELKNNSLGDLKLFRILPNPEGDYLHDINGYFTYSYATTFYFDASTNVTLETKRADPCASDPVMYLFNSSDPVNGGTWSDDDGGDCSQSKITCTIQNSGTYWVFIRSKTSNGAQTTNLYLNDVLYASNIAVSGAVYDCDYTSLEVMNYFTTQSTSGDPKLWIESYDGKILAYNDDYSGSGDFVWQQNARVKKSYSQRMGKCLLTSSSTYYPSGYCDLYMRCKNSTIMSYFPNLEADDAIRSAPATSYPDRYNCISWSGGITSYWEWPLNSGSDYFVPGDSLACFDCFYGNVDRYGNRCVRDVSPNTRSWNYTRNGATSSNNQIDLWSLNRAYKHASVKAKWSDLSLGNPANDNPHGYDWESKPGDLMRTFHPRNALSGNLYGDIDKYYRSDGTYETLSLNKNDAREEVAFSENEIKKLNSLVEKISNKIVNEANIKYASWKETWTNPNIIIHSDPREYAKSKEYEELLDFCKKEGNLLPLIIQKFNNGDFFVLNLLEDLTYKNNTELMDEVKEENKKFGVSRSLKDNWLNYSKKILTKDVDKLEGEVSGNSEEKVGKISTLPDEFTLEQNYPNPFNPVTQIRYGLPTPSEVLIKIYNLLGKEIAVLVNNEIKPEGWYTVVWDGRDNHGNPVASGIYFCRLISGTNVQTIKLMLMK